MSGTVISLFIINLVTYGILFFGIPYWTGKEMADLSKNGIYVFLFKTCSWIGGGLYFVIEWAALFICSSIENFFDFKWLRKALLFPINIILYILIIHLFNFLYSEILLSLLPVNFDGFALRPDTSYLWVSDTLIIFNILISQFSGISNIVQVLSLIGCSIGILFFYLVITVIYFSALYGLLRSKLKELHLLTKHSNSVSSFLDKEIKFDGWKSAFWKLLQGSAEFIEKFAVPKPYMNRAGFISLLIVLFVYSCIGAFRGDTPDFLALTVDIVDEMNVVNTIVSFIISYLLAKATVAGCSVAYQHLPKEAQNMVNQAERFCQDLTKKMEDKRTQWDKPIEQMYSFTEENGHFSSDNIEQVREMNLDQSVGERRTTAEKATSSQPREKKNVKKIAQTLKEAYDKQMDYQDLDGNIWYYCKGAVLARLKAGNYTSGILILLPDGTVEEHKQKENPWNLDFQDVFRF